MSDAQSAPFAGDLERRREASRTRAHARLWAAVWEASQFMTPSQIHEHVEGTLQEVKADAP